MSVSEATVAVVSAMMVLGMVVLLEGMNMRVFVRDCNDTMLRVMRVERVLHREH